ncbi:general odorant-binding protein lush-like isoform X2 [Sitodiplosis mosellana]|uniref:general odorant-binding protein lush-like isoform X2 n=1 Tax=Sitodiplosis mosellana TaxID=263140 RepID=UPI0024437559|nr:general odorant-binding protein lush-like isoform X2 [Sitodiplosis mosellana]
MEHNKVTKLVFVLVAILLVQIDLANTALTMKQFEKTLEVFRNACLPKSGAAVEAVDALKKGVFPDDDKSLKCYVYCVIEMGGVLSRKKEVIDAKMETQARVILPPELQEFALKGWENCRTVPKQYKDHCDRIYYTVKCTYNTDPSKFTFA